MTVPIRPYWPTAAQTLHTLCVYIQRHSTTLVSVVATVDPVDAAAVAAAFVALNAACTLFITVMDHVDPNWKPK